MISNKIKVITAVASVAAAAYLFAGSVASGPHNLSALQGTDDNAEICVYCHTPHAANSTFVGAPLWNKADVNASTFTMYGETIAATSTAATPANSSLACLSCHDGVSAIDSIVNAPGSGSGSLVATTKITDIATPYGGNIGKDLRNDHPVSIQYIEGRAGLRNTGVSFVTDLGQTAWLGAATVSELLRGAGSDQVECGSCHDPHNGGLVQGTADEVNFLRHTNTGSQLCLGCHNK